MIPEEEIKIDRYGKDNGDGPPSHAIVATHIPTGKYVIEKMKGEGFLTSDNVVDRLNELVFPEKKYKDISEFFEREGPEDIERFVDKNLDISQFVYARMKERGWKVKDLAEAVGKSENKISKWLTGCHDLTLRDITRMESALGVDIITVSK